MRYTSTRDRRMDVNSAQAVLRGISPEGGLFLPARIPQLTLMELEALAELDYVGRAEYILDKFFTAEGGWSRDEMHGIVQAAYGNTFRSPEVAPLRELGGGDYVLELFHGPTCAFKDLALQILPRLLTASAEKSPGAPDEIMVLVATSGDTGKAALEGFKDVPGTKICVFYPSEGVSAVQKRQMESQEGGNVKVVGVRGNFDDTQSGVKAMFADKALQSLLRARKRAFSSANSINWGRLAPQIVYYISAYCDLMNRRRIKRGDPVVFAVPTGNFGDILAGYYAKEMGLPVKKLLCASNRNRVLTDFLATGVYDRQRPFYTTSSPSMDILISSNLERLLFLAARGDSAKVARWMRELAADGRYEIPPALLGQINRAFAGDSCDEEQTARAIAETWTARHYLSDTHTAAALHALRGFRQAAGDETPAVVIATASPYKFAGSVLAALGQTPPEDEFAAMEALEAATGIPCPAPLRGLRVRAVRFTEVCAPQEMRNIDLRF